LQGKLIGIPDERCFPDVRGERSFRAHTVFGRNEPAMIHYHHPLRPALGLPLNVRETVSANSMELAR